MKEGERNVSEQGVKLVLLTGLTNHWSVHVWSCHHHASPQAPYQSREWFTHSPLNAVGQTWSGLSHVFYCRFTIKAWFMMPLRWLSFWQVLWTTEAIGFLVTQVQDQTWLLKFATGSTQVLHMLLYLFTDLALSQSLLDFWFDFWLVNCRTQYKQIMASIQSATVRG